ncbi:hypothetical protein H5410_057462 [Solanum commersonii]|uniref:Cellulose synthase n=1 Tax=Solanum commersonii TaxID=4109 RepID=A0A9J5WQP2_SOLCO|nr:hypothetical protein H5410_057462 [Solanum commersonii]
MMPLTPDNQPGAMDTSGDKPDGPGPYGLSRFRIESQRRMGSCGGEDDDGGARGENASGLDRRLVVLIFFLMWRITNLNPDAMWLWGVLIVCELWFAFSWLLDILPKFNPINKSADLVALKKKLKHRLLLILMVDLIYLELMCSFLQLNLIKSLLLSLLILYFRFLMSNIYYVEKVYVYISDDGGAIFKFEATAEAVIFGQKTDPMKNKKLPDFVKDRRWIKREYDEFKVRTNGLRDVIRKRCEMHNSKEEKKEKALAKENNGGSVPEDFKFQKVPVNDPIMGGPNEKQLEFTGIDIRLPMFVYVSREKCPSYDHNKKAGAMNALVRDSAILSNGPFILNLDCDHYFYNSMAIQEVCVT